MSTTDRAIRKVTVHLPDDLLRDAQAATGKGITETIRKALEVVIAGRRFEGSPGKRDQRRAGS